MTMILQSVTIKDYKQFRGEHTFTPNPNGIVGVIGQNGAGKSTLFEAIEWCLYQPREILAAEIFPRGSASSPTVVVALVDTDGVLWSVERSLSKSRSAQASVRRDEATFVIGSKQVTEYVTGTLLGLGHRAFTSTFFTRQKELSFFGTMTETDRRREVGRLLGLDVVREAQRIIGTDRTEYVSRAKALLAIADKDDAEGNWEAREADLQVLIRFTADTESSFATDRDAEEEKLRNLRAELELAHARDKQHRELQAAVPLAESKVQFAQAQVATAVARLQEVRDAEALVPELEATVALLPELDEQLRVWEQRREADTRRVDLEVRIKASESKIAQMRERRGLYVTRTPALDEATLDRRREQAQELCERLAKERDANRERLAAVNAESGVLGGEIRRYLDMGEHSVCPTCGQPVDPEITRTSLEQARYALSDKMDEIRTLTALGKSLDDQLKAGNDEYQDAVQAKIQWMGLVDELSRLDATILEGTDALAGMEVELARLYAEGFDPESYEAVRKRHAECSAELGRLRTVRQILTHGPMREEALRIAHEAEAAALAELQTAELNLATFREGYDPDPIDVLATLVATAEHNYSTAELRLRECAKKLEAHKHDLAMLTRDKDRVQKARDDASAARSSADELDFVYASFSRFEEFVAARITPALSDYTSRLVAEITEGKYDRVEFDGSYGIRVYDGLDESFPIEEFSGGERDVISLSARLALSRLIGSQATNPPSFMVMDEVFGSLDQDRRQNTMLALARLAGTESAFRQLFVISHVDDVRMTPMFTEVWTVRETGDGTSELRREAGVL